MSKIPALLQSGTPLVMGILNTTPDSFSDGGCFDTVDNALAQAMLMLEQGADIIDIGGESTRPGAEAVSADEEIQRVVPVIESIRRHSEISISIDTSKPEVMLAAVAAGANLVNDVNGLQAQGAVEACSSLGIPVCVMHMQGEPRTMQDNPRYNNVLADVASYLQSRAQACLDAGICRENIIIDPGFGFGKNLQHNLQLLNGLDQLRSLGYPVLVGLSRKSMLGAVLDGAATDQRLHASVAAAVLAWTRGAKIFRVHDVKPTVDALKVCEAVNRSAAIK